MRSAFIARDDEQRDKAKHTKKTDRREKMLRIIMEPLHDNAAQAVEGVGSLFPVNYDGPNIPHARAARSTGGRRMSAWPKIVKGRRERI